MVSSQLKRYRNPSHVIFVLVDRYFQGHRAARVSVSDLVVSTLIVCTGLLVWLHRSADPLELVGPLLSATFTSLSKDKLCAVGLGIAFATTTLESFQGVMAESVVASGGSISNAIVEVLPSTQRIPDLGSESLNCASASKTPPYSQRIATMMQERENCSDVVEFDIAFSKDHWTAVDDEEDSEDDENCALENRKALLKANQKALENLRNHSLSGSFFSYSLADRFPESLPLTGQVGEKIAEGGQATIYESSNKGFVFKVFKRGLLLEELQKQWPQEVFSSPIPHSNNLLEVGIVLDDGRFAFLMRKYWGDLRHAIDLRMLVNKNSGPPFHRVEILILMETIVPQMVYLHSIGVCHKDLKADNILVLGVEYSTHIRHDCRVADYECSSGALGTTFWRAPEILLAERNFVSAKRIGQEPTPIPFSKAADVYSFGMLLYEISTGLVPFEREGLYGKPSDENYDRVIDGERPALPDDMHAVLKDLITKCWHGNAEQRPTFQEIMRHYVTGFQLNCQKDRVLPFNYYVVSTGHQRSKNPCSRKAIRVQGRQLSMRQKKKLIKRSRLKY